MAGRAQQPLPRGRSGDEPRPGAFAECRFEQQRAVPVQFLCRCPALVDRRGQGRRPPGYGARRGRDKQPPARHAQAQYTGRSLRGIPAAVTTAKSSACRTSRSRYALTSAAAFPSRAHP